MPPLEAFPIIPITDDMIVQDEPMGSKDKFWCQLPDDAAGGGRWLFKQPRPEPEKIEHLAEKIAQELATLINVPCARIELAEYKGIRGTISLDVQGPGDALVHGNEVIAGRVMGYNRKQKRRSSDHTFERIRQAILEVCQGDCDDDLRQFAGYLVLDALIGNTDRHHENWALLRCESATGATYRLAPSFDHASSLGRELQDHRRQLLLQQNRIEQYVRNAGGSIYLAEFGDRPISPLELVQRLKVSLPESFEPWFNAVEAVTPDRVAAIFDRIPSEWITPAQRQFATALLTQTRSLLIDKNS